CEKARHQSVGGRRQTQSPKRSHPVVGSAKSCQQGFGRKSAAGETNSAAGQTNSPAGQTNSETDTIAGADAHTNLATQSEPIAQSGSHSYAYCAADTDSDIEAVAVADSDTITDAVIDADGASDAQS